MEHEKKYEKLLTAFPKIIGDIGKLWDIIMEINIEAAKIESIRIKRISIQRR
ncbi:MAG: hypothetical protein M3R36_02585 [Bacteroidota bacterium]|nr:hypothetical protein [Bacteroidota bacterium]